MKHELTHLDLFSGIGGFALAARNAGFRTIGFSEVEHYACRVLAERFPGVPNLGDVRKRESFTGIGRVTVLTGGFPCQPFSVAGKQRGKDDDRHLWPSMLGVIEAVRPTWIIGENVPGIIDMELDNLLADLESAGYETQPFVIPACAVDARHRRDRLWVLAHSRHLCGRERAEPTKQEISTASGCRPILADAASVGSPRQGESISPVNSTPVQNWEDDKPINDCEPYIWPIEPTVGRVVDGLPSRMDRVKGLGNAIVPQVAEVFLRAIASQLTA